MGDSYSTADDTSEDEALDALENADLYKYLSPTAMSQGNYLVSTASGSVASILPTNTQEDEIAFLQESMPTAGSSSSTTSSLFGESSSPSRIMVHSTGRKESGKLTAFPPTIQLKTQEFMRLLECPICLQVSTSSSKFFMCQAGHIVCDVCHPKISCCPICKAHLLGTRNFFAESLWGMLKVPCIYKKHGCTKLVHVTDFDPHLAACSFK